MTLTGKLDISTLTKVPSQPSMLLDAASAASWERLADAVEAAWGWRPRLNDAYRTYERQVALFTTRFTTEPLRGSRSKVWQNRTWWLKPGMSDAAVPGTSNHGKAGTVDIADLGGYKGKRFSQFSQIAPLHGWNNAEGASVDEPWHWTRVDSKDQYRHPTPTTPTTPEDDIMASLDDLRVALAERSPLFRIARTHAAYRDLGSARRHITGEQNVTGSRIVDLPASDPFWRLPIIGPAGELYKRTNADPAYTVEDGKLRHVQIEEYVAIGRPPIISLPDSDPIWSLLSSV